MQEVKLMKEEGVKFSVVIPLYNKAEHIVDTVFSALNQTRPADEIIIINDGSTDGGERIVRNLFPQVIVVDQENSGVAKARNLGLSIAKNKWVAFLDGDDLWLVNHLEELGRTILSVPHACLISTSWVEVGHAANGPEADSRPSEKKEINYFREALSSRPACSSAAAVCREHALNIGGFRNYKIGEDSDFWTRMALSFPVAKSSKVTSLYKKVSDSAMAIHGDISRYGIINDSPPSTLEDLKQEMGVLVNAAKLEDCEEKKVDLVKYLDMLLAMKAKQSLVRGDCKGARDYLRLLRFRRKDAVCIGLVAWLPSRFVWELFQLRRRIKLIGRYRSK